MCSFGGTFLIDCLHWDFRDGPQFNLIIDGKYPKNTAAPQCGR